jgi:hypothetical protein
MRCSSLEYRQQNTLQNSELPNLIQIFQTYKTNSELASIYLSISSMLRSRSKADSQTFIVLLMKLGRFDHKKYRSV